jgi:hypothetical protein
MRKPMASAKGKAMGMAALLGMAKGAKPAPKKAAPREKKPAKPKRGSMPPMMPPMGGGPMGPMGM